MKLLWLTLADPDPPTNGQFIYSRGLIHAAAAAGATVEVVGLDRPEACHRDGRRADGLVWSLAEHRPRALWRGLATPLPFMAFRVMTRQMQGLVRAALDRAAWDAVVFDSLAAGWALPAVLRRRPRPGVAPPRLVYIAHNHEAQVAQHGVADETRTLRRLVKRIDARRVARLERALVATADLVTSNSPEDRGKFQAARPTRTVLFLPPGYDGARCAARRITPATPRRALIVGSFDWSAKRQSLEAFLAIADPQFAAAGIELLVVGNAEPGYLDRLRKTVRATRFTGRVDDVAPYFSQARLALVPDRLGGFKLKTLDYVFHRLPILAIDGAVPGLPLHPGESIFLAPDHDALARDVLALIDDFARLNGAQGLAYHACQDCFDWSAVGTRLLRAIDDASGAARVVTVRRGAR
ncbi:MAG TPA: glycosyltransferase [Candidatus Sulfotelmatobacter sp.]|nr:glycosyltransferase [Candidatus Sulfotelmatobacter sp.]